MTPDQPFRHPEEILEDVARRFGLDVDTLRGDARRNFLTYPRGLVARELRQQGRSLDEVGEWLGGRDHSSVLYLLRRADEIEASKTKTNRRRTRR